MITDDDMMVEVKNAKEEMEVRAILKDINDGKYDAEILEELKRGHCDNYIEVKSVILERVQDKSEPIRIPKGWTAGDRHDTTIMEKRGENDLKVDITKYSSSDKFNVSIRGWEYSNPIGISLDSKDIEGIEEAVKVGEFFIIMHKRILKTWEKNKDNLKMPLVEEILDDWDLDELRIETEDDLTKCLDVKYQDINRFLEMRDWSGVLDTYQKRDAIRLEMQHERERLLKDLRTKFGIGIEPVSVTSTEEDEEDRFRSLNFRGDEE